LVLGGYSTVGDARRPGGFEPVAAGLADAVAAAVVFVVGGHVADPGVQAHGLVLAADAVAACTLVDQSLQQH
jgi:hypothetical protein